MKLATLTLLLSSAFVCHGEMPRPIDMRAEIWNSCARDLLAASNPEVGSSAITETPATPGATPAISRKRHWEARFRELDTNGDGRLTLEEFLAGPMGKKSPEKAKAFF